MSKESVSKSYMQRQKDAHAAKPMKEFRCATVIGSNKKDNIGAAIARKLTGFCKIVDEVEKDEYDFSKYESCESFCDKIGERDILILCNGFTELDWIENSDPKKIKQIIDDSLLASIYAAKAFAAKTIDHPYKKYIVFVGSMAHRNVLNGSSVYCAAKAGLAMFSKCIAWELAPKGFNAFCINPSNTDGTPMAEKTISDLQRYREISREEAESYWAACLPKDKWLNSENIADVTEFLISGKADYMSGSNIDLAGGQR